MGCCLWGRTGSGTTEVAAGMAYKWNLIFFLIGLTSFTYPVFKVHPCRSMCQNSFCF